MGRELVDRALAEDAVRAAAVEWVIVRPTRLTVDPTHGVYHAGPEVRAGFLARISRADVAELLVRQLTEDAFFGQAPTITR